MFDFAIVYQSRKETLSRLEILQSTASRLAPLENASTLSIQRLFRGQRVRARHTVKRHACINIQRCFRGSLGRTFTHELRLSKNRAEDVAVFHYHAMIVQRTFRGFYSRRYYHDYSARKAYILSVVEKGDRLRATLAERLKEQEATQAAEKAEQALQEFKKVTANLHHLVSTQAMPGIYNSPYCAGNVPTAMGVPVEVHLRSGVKDLLRTRLSQPPVLVPDLNGSKRLPVKGPVSKLSLQASSTYNAVLEAQRAEQRLGRKQWRSERNFLGGGRTKEQPYARGVNEGTPFLDMYKNPFFQRGEPQKEGAPRMSQSTPFYTSVGGNKSSVLPNGLFDVILDAQIDGCVTNKKKVATQRRAMSQSNPAYNGGNDEPSLIIPES